MHPPSYDKESSTATATAAADACDCDMTTRPLLASADNATTPATTSFYGSVLTTSDEASDSASSNGVLRSMEEGCDGDDSADADSSGGRIGGSIHHSIRQLSRRVKDLVSQHTGSIGMLGSLSIAVNSILGPAMLSLPATFVKSGLIPTTATLLFVCFLSSFCSLNLANTISRVPGNANFKKEVEYSEAFRHFLGQRWFYFTQIIFFSCVTCLNISSIVDTANVVDTFFGHWWPWGGTAAIRVYMDSHHESGETIKLEYWDYSLCSSAELQDGLCLPFRSGHEYHQDAHDAADSLLFTLGSLVTTLIFLPLALLDLKENAVWQILGFIIAIIISFQFIIQFAFADTLVFARVPLWGTEWTDLMGVVLFNFALVIAVPAWLYEREPHVDIPTVVHGSNFISCFLYVSVGLLGAVAMPNVSDNMLESMMSGLFGTFLQLGASIFAFFIIGLGSPLFSVLTRLNLMGSGLCSRTTGNLMAVYFPFAMAWLLHNGSAITALLSWGGVIFSSLVVFILPSALTLYVVQEYDYQGTMSVYYGKFTSKPQEIITSRVILAVTAASVVVALVGLVFASSS